MPTLTDRITALRAAGITPDRIARLAGTHRPGLIRWLRRNGGTRVSLDVRLGEAVATLEAEIAASASAASTETSEIVSGKPMEELA